MRCKDFDAYIDEMLSGVLYPDANQHMRQCERCTSHYRARAAVQTGLRNLATASATGPSPATDRAVMDAYRLLQQRRAQPQSGPRPAARLLTFPGRASVPSRISSRFSSTHWWGGAAAAAVVLAVLGSGLHMRHGSPMVIAPMAATATAPSALPSVADASVPVKHEAVTASLASRHVSQQGSQYVSQPTGQFSGLQARLGVKPPSGSHSGALQGNAVQGNAASSEVASAALGTAPKPQAGVSPLVHLASSETAVGSANNAAQSAGSTWPGYSNLVYCDPVVCSGPMQVVHIKVPAGQVKPNAGESVGNGYVNADVVVGPDGVARAIRVAN
jgi:hypothetical protein